MVVVKNRKLSGGPSSLICCLPLPLVHVSTPTGPLPTQHLLIGNSVLTTTPKGLDLLSCSVHSNVSRGRFSAGTCIACCPAGTCEMSAGTALSSFLYAIDSLTPRTTLKMLSFWHYITIIQIRLHKLSDNII